MVAEVNEFPQSDRLRTPTEALTDMMMLGAQIERVLIIGADANGALTIMSSQMTLADANWMIDRAKLTIVTGDY